VKLGLIALSICSMFLPGCATILTGTTDEVAFDSVPRSARLTVKTQHSGTPVYHGQTPALVELKRKHVYRAELELPGYEPISVLIDQVFNGWALLNILCGGIIGGAIDIVTGAFWWLDTDHISVRMIALPSAPGVPVAPPPGVWGPHATPRLPTKSLPDIGLAAKLAVAARADDGEGQALYALFVARDASGELRGILVPLFRKAQ
jgi:hypothetical protein